MSTRGLPLAFLAVCPVFAAEPLFQAIQTADTAAVKRLLDGGVSPDLKGSDGTPALMAATLYAGADCVKLLLDRGANPNAANAAGATPLMWAIPDAAKVKLLLAHGADVNARSTNLQRTPLLVAASYPGSTEVLKLLLDKGADIHAKDRSGTHALGRATSTADVSVVRFLVEQGCDPNEPGYGYGIAGRNFARHDLPAIEYLMSKGVKIDKPVLAFAANWHDPKLLEKWIAMGADVNAKAGPYGRMPLMTATASEQAGPATLKLLLEKGADPNAEDADGERPLDWAMYRADQGKIDVLRQFGATPGKGPRQKSWPAPSGDGFTDPRLSLSKSVALLMPTGPVVFQKRGCISCHSQALTAQLAAVARMKGIALNEEPVERNLKQILAFSGPSAEAAMQGDQPAGMSLTVGYILAALDAERHPLDNVTASFTHLVAAAQMPDGTLLGNGVSRPPMEDSTVSTTVIAMHSLNLYPLPGDKANMEEKLRRTQRWLLAVESHTTEERGMRLMGLVWTKAPRADINAAVEQIVAKQRPGGGWSQLDHFDPDAYATGLSLYALHQAGIPVTGEVYRKGIAFLLKNQYQDGSWLVKTRAYPTQPNFDSGYPFGYNQWISAAGASWASLAIAATLPDSKK